VDLRAVSFLTNPQTNQFVAGKMAFVGHRSEHRFPTQISFFVLQVDTLFYLYLLHHFSWAVMNYERVGLHRIFFPGQN
jgi:hypothetical protein